MNLDLVSDSDQSSDSMEHLLERNSEKDLSISFTFMTNFPVNSALDQEEQMSEKNTLGRLFSADVNSVYILGSIWGGVKVFVKTQGHPLP